MVVVVVVGFGLAVGEMMLDGKCLQADVFMIGIGQLRACFLLLSPFFFSFFGNGRFVKCVWISDDLCSICVVLIVDGRDCYVFLVMVFRKAFWHWRSCRGRNTNHDVHDASPAVSGRMCCINFRFEPAVCLVLFGLVHRECPDADWWPVAVMQVPKAVFVTVRCRCPPSVTVTNLV